VDGTVVATVGAVDQDEGDVVAVTFASGNEDGAFALDERTGLVTVDAGYLLDHELEPGRTLHLVATDRTGLTDEVDLDVTIDDVTTFEQVATYTFTTVERDLWRNDFTWDAELGLGGHNYGGTRSKSVSLGPILSASWTTTASGTMDWDATVDISTGVVNASLPVEVSVVFPDSVRLGEPFTLTTSYTLQDDAAMWGDSPSVTLHASYELDEYGFTTKVAASSSLVGRSGSDEVSVGPYTLPRSTIDFDMVGTSFTSARFDALYPDGVDLASDDHAIGWMADALDLGTSGTYDEPELLVTEPFEVSMYSGYYDWDNWLAQVLPAWAGKNVGKIPIDLGEYDLTVTYEFLNAYIQLWMGLEQGFYLRIAGIEATLVFEDGTTATVALGEPLTLTLPVDADVDADGRVDVTATFAVDAELTNSSEPYLRYDSYTRVLASSAKLTDYAWSEYYQRFQTYTIASYALDPVASFGWTLEHDFDGHTATGSVRPTDATSLDVELTSPLSAPITFRLDGFNQPTMRGGIQVAP
jgi:hypothetical protein